MESFTRALAAYKADVGHFPAEDAGLRALVFDTGDRGWKGPYLSKDIPLDPWGNPYAYKLANMDQPEVASYGADGTPGGEGAGADLSSKDLSAKEVQKLPNGH